MSDEARVAHGRALEVPELSLVLLVGASGSGKSTFAQAHFLPTEVLSSDFCRGLVADDENDQSATKEAFELLHFIAGKRLAAGRLTVVDATNVKREDRAAARQRWRASITSCRSRSCSTYPSVCARTETEAGRTATSART